MHDHVLDIDNRKAKNRKSTRAKSETIHATIGSRDVLEAVNKKGPRMGLNTDGHAAFSDTFWNEILPRWRIPKAFFLIKTFLQLLRCL